MSQVPPTMRQIYERILRGRLARYEGNKTATANSLGISIKTLYNKMHEFSMEDQIAVYPKRRRQ